MPNNSAEQQALRASRVWDIVARGGAPEPADLDASFVMTISRLRELASDPRPDPDFAQRLETELLRAQTSALLRALPTTRDLTSATNGAAAPEPIAQSSPQLLAPALRRWLAPLATAALILLVLAGTLILTKGPWRLSAGNVLPVILPAIADTPEPDVPDGISEDMILMEARVDDIPPDAASEQIERTKLSPGAEWARGKRKNDAEGPSLYRIESGELSVNADGPIIVTRGADGRAITIPPGTDIVLRAEDQGFTPSGVTARWRNDGTTPAVVLGAGITSFRDDQVPEGVIYVELVAKAILVPKDPSDVTVRRVTLLPAAELSVDSIPGLQLVYPESGEFTVIDGQPAAATSNPLATNVAVKRTRMPREVPTLTSFPLGRIIRNTSDAPATLLLMTATNVQAAEATPSADTDNAATLTPDAAIGTREDTLLMQGTFDTFPKLATWEGIARATLAPGTEMALGASENDGEGPMLYRVEFGELIINADGPISITRTGTTTAESIPAGTDVVLQEGDQGFTPSGVTSRWRNARQVPAVILDAGITTSGYGALPAGVTHDAVVSTYTSAPKSPVAVSVRRLTLQPQQALGPRDLAGVQLLFVESGEIEVVYADQLDLSNNIFATGPKSKPGQTVAAGSAYPAGFPADGGFRVSGSDPATVLVMTVTDVNAGAGSPMN